MNNSKQNIIEILQRFPGIGPKQAERFYYFLVKQNKTFIDNFKINLDAIKLNSFRCESCYSFFTLDNIENNNKHNRLCHICADNNRDINKLLIVEKEMDQNAIEYTSEYNGLYFVMGGKLPTIVKDPREHIRIIELVEKVSNKIIDNTLEEIIFALPATSEGELEMNYIKKTISQIPNIDKINITMLARGVSTGLEMEYVDRDTFKNAFERRF
jgi:recombination protein RecR